MDQNKRNTERKAVSLLVQLKHADVGTFTEEYATNLSPGGMFIRSRQPQPVGTKMKFEVQIAGGVRVMRGAAVVRWVRQPNDPEGGPGMGVQFLELDEATRALVDRMLAKKSDPQPEAAELEAELRARHGEPPPKPAAAAPTAPKIPAVAPVAAPKVPAVAPAVPKVAAPKAPAVAPVAQVAAPVVPPVAPPVQAVKPPAPAADPFSFELEDEPPPPERKSFELKAATNKAADLKPFEDEIPGDEPLDAFAQVAKQGPPPASDDIDISFEDLISSTPPSPKPEEPKPVAAKPAEPPPPPAKAAQPPPPPTAAVAPPPFEVEEESSDSGDEEGFELDVESSTEAPAAAAPPPPPPQSKGGSSMEIEFDPGDDAPLELDTGKSGRNIPSRPAPSLGPAPKSSGAAKAAPSPASAPPAAPATPPRPSAAAGPELPQVRRDARPAAPPQMPPPKLDSPTQPVAPPPPSRQSGPPPLVFLKPPTEALPTTGPVVGIDLGTTNSCVAVLVNTRPQVLRSKDGYNTIPSVVSVNMKNQLLVSHRAKSQLLLNPNNTIYGAKRLVGRSFDSATVRQVRERFHYEVVPDSAGNAAVRLKENVLSLEEVQGLILRECKEMAEQQINQKVHRAVITVPAYYSEPQREAVRKAGALAGLKVERILNEPTAAALAYGLNRELSKKVLVYDLGGGTFDATVLRIEKNVFEVLATGGDIFLGGLDFDNLIVDRLLQKFQEQHGMAFSGDSGALTRVTDAAERAKMALSERNSTDIELPMLMMDPGTMQSKDLRCQLTRAELNEVCAPLLNRTLDVVRDVLLDAKLKASHIDDVILVGGMSRMPMVREKLKELFGKQPHASVNADEAVALGAALYSGSVDKVSSVTLIDVLPMTIGIGLPGGAFKRVVERNTPLPAQASFGLSTTRDNEEFLELSLFQGEDNHVAGNEYLGTVRVEGLPKMPKGHVKVAVTIRLDAECVLHVEAREMSTRKEIKASLATRYTSEELQAKLNFSKDQVKAAEEKREQDLKDRGGRFWGFLKKAFGR